MSTSFYVYKKSEYERHSLVKEYLEKIQRMLPIFLDQTLPPELKDDVQITDDLERANGPMCRQLAAYIDDDASIRFCTVTGNRVIFHYSELEAAEILPGDKLLLIDEYGEVELESLSLEELFAHMRKRTSIPTRKE